LDVDYIKILFLQQRRKSLIEFRYFSFANLKRKQALLRSNLPAIRFADVDKLPLCPERLFQFIHVVNG